MTQHGKRYPSRGNSNVLLIQGVMVKKANFTKILTKLEFSGQNYDNNKHIKDAMTSVSCEISNGIFVYVFSCFPIKKT